jgi:hypothetical protein
MRQEDNNKYFDDDKIDGKPIFKRLKEEFNVLQARSTDLEARMIRRNQE